MQTQRSYGQDSTSKVAVVISPALFVPVSVAAQSGIQLVVSPRFTILAEGAYPLFEPDNTGYQDINYWRAGVEIRYQLRKKTYKRYLAIQCNYLFRELVNTTGGNYFTRDRTFAFSNARIKSPVLSTALKVGVELPLGRRTFFDVFAGAGVRMIFNRYDTKSAILTSIEPEKEGFFKFNNAWLFNYTLLRPNITAGVRFGVWL